MTARFLGLWVNSCNHDKPFYIKPRIREQLNIELSKIKPPKEVPRAIRPLSSLNNFKASEFDTYLLYVIPVIMRYYLPQQYYDHFLLLSFSSWKLLAHNISQKDLYLCRRALIMFVKRVEILYGEDQLTHNLHLLTHLTEVVENIGSLVDVNGYIFEHFNGVVRNMAVGNNNVAKEIVKRFELSFDAELKLIEEEDKKKKQKERRNLSGKTSFESKFQIQFQQQFSGPVPKYQYSKLSMNNISYTSASYSSDKKSSNCFVTLDQGECFQILSFIENDTEIFAFGNRFTTSNPIFVELDDSEGKEQLKLEHIHELGSSIPTIINVSLFKRKVLVVETRDTTFGIEINSFAF